jgi:hypothetical protein
LTTLTVLWSISGFFILKKRFA